MSGVPPDLVGQEAELRRTFQGQVRVVRTLDVLSLAIFLTLIVIGSQAAADDGMLADPLAAVAIIAGIVVVIALMFFKLWYLKCPFCGGDILKTDAHGLQLVWNVARCRHCQERLK